MFFIIGGAYYYTIAITTLGSLVVDISVTIGITILVSLLVDICRHNYFGSL
jgi:hypothetical protein